MPRVLGRAAALLLLSSPLFGQIDFTQLPLPEPRTVNPHAIAFSNDGNLWFTDATYQQVGFITFNDHQITRFPLVDSADPGNLVLPQSITSGPDGNMWFTSFVTDSAGTSLNRSAVNKITPAGAITTYPTPTGSACNFFFGTLPGCSITAGPDRNLWVASTEFGPGRIIRVTPDGVTTEFPVNQFALVEIAAGPDGNVWTTARAGGLIRTTPVGVHTVFPVPDPPGGLSGTWGVTAGVDGNVWYTNTSPSARFIGQMTPAGEVTEFSLPNPAAAPTNIVQAADGNIYFTQGGIGGAGVGWFDPKASTPLFGESLRAGFTPLKITAGFAVSPKVAYNALRDGGTPGIDVWDIFIANTPLAGCSISCPLDIHVTAAFGANTANVPYPAPTLNNCPAGTGVTVSHDSGSAFPLGTTTVTATTSSGESCDFKITVTSEVLRLFETADHTRWAGEAADPVSTTTGELYERDRPDLWLGGPLPVHFSRSYASKIVTDRNASGSLGTNWLHNFEWNIESVGAGTLGVVSASGRVYRFNRSGDAWMLIGPLDVPVRLIETPSGYTFGDPLTEVVRTFDSAGRMTRVEDTHGNALTLTYEADRLAEVADGLGRSLLFAYDGGRLESVSDGTRTVRFTHAGDHLATVVDALGHTTTYGYAANGTLTSTTRQRGNIPYTQTFDGSARVATQTTAAGNTTTFAYEPGRTTVTDAAAVSIAHAHNALPGGELTAHTDPSGRSIALGYDAAGRRAAVSDRLGDTTRMSWHAPSGKIAETIDAEEQRTTFAYGTRTFAGITLHPLTAITYADGTAESFSYDGSGNLLSRTDRSGKIWTFTRNARGQVLTATNPAGGVTTYTYNGDGTVATSRDSDTGTTTFGYDALHRLNRITHPDSASVQLEYDAADRVAAITDELGRRHAFAHDANGNLVEITDPAAKETRIAYDAMDRVAEIVDRVGARTTTSFNDRELRSGVTDPNDNRVAFAWDERRRLASVTDAGGGVWSLGWDDESVASSTTNPLDQTSTRSTNRLGLVTAMRNALGEEWTLTRDAMQRVTAVADPLGRSTSTAYDARGLVASITRPIVGTAAYQRNDLGLITSVRDLNGQSWERTYTAAGRLATTRDPLGRLAVRALDDRGRTSSITFADGVRASNTYDSAGNLTRAAYTSGPDLQYGYDTLDRLISAGGTTISYDTEGRPLSTTSNGLTAGATYDAGGRLASVTYENGAFAVNYVYDARNLVTRVSDTRTGTRIDLSWDAAHRMTGITRSNGIHTAYARDGAGRIIRIQHGAIADLRYTLDAAGQVRAEEGARPLDPATADLAAVEAAFTFDAASQIDSAGFAHDLRGRRTAGGGHTFVWDGASRLTAIDSTTFEYDGLGQLLRRTGPATTTYTYNVALGRGTIVGDGSRWYVYLPNGTLLYAIEGGSATHYHFDRTGSTLALTNAAGQVTDTYAYDPFGLLLARVGSSAQPFLYAGRHGVRAEPAANLYQMRARYYDPSTARFLSKDPVVSLAPQAINPYQYAYSDPIGWVDPSGLQNLVSDEVNDLPASNASDTLARIRIPVVRESPPSLEEPFGADRREAVAKMTTPRSSPYDPRPYLELLFPGNIPSLPVTTDTSTNLDFSGESLFHLCFGALSPPPQCTVSMELKPFSGESLGSYGLGIRLGLPDIETLDPALTPGFRFQSDPALTPGFRFQPDPALTPDFRLHSGEFDNRISRALSGARIRF